ncbi:hypothetical protein CC78DRAFT_534853 [Lojkania enalia]|uniref:Uncharacterized protein n=1 Tax=Lojkania enalia TaxID=147567 RepID=A0A9P4N7L3_9PLEO|nr:hypothetical protein CC78DRAFT_534853 [Didymosphaeria enalia]
MSISPNYLHRPPADPAPNHKPSHTSAHSIPAHHNLLAPPLPANNPIPIRAPPLNSEPALNPLVDIFMPSLPFLPSPLKPAPQPTPFQHPPSIPHRKACFKLAYTP